MVRVDLLRAVVKNINAQKSKGIESKLEVHSRKCRPTYVFVRVRLLAYVRTYMCVCVCMVHGMCVFVNCCES